MTVALPDLWRIPHLAAGVYTPQQDSRLLIETMERTTLVVGRRVADLCTGSGVVAVAAAGLGAKSVVAWDTSGDAVDCATRNAGAAAVEVRLGSLPDALADGPYDVVVSNPPYVPTCPQSQRVSTNDTGPIGAWDGGEDGRSFLDPLCRLAFDLLAPGGTLLFVQSEFSDIDASLMALRANGLTAEVVGWQRIPFGPVLTAQAQWLERTGGLQQGRRDEELLVVKADKP